MKISYEWQCHYDTLLNRVKRTQTALSADDRFLHIVCTHATDTDNVKKCERRHATDTDIQIFQKCRHATDTNNPNS